MLQGTSQGPPGAQGAKVRPTGPRYQPLVIVAAAVCAGIVADRYCRLPPAVWWAAVVSAWAAWLVLWHGQWDRTAGVVLLLAVAACGGAWHGCRWRLFAEDDLGFFARPVDYPVCVRAVARTGPRRLPAPPTDPMRGLPLGDRSSLAVDLVGIRDRAEWRPASGRTKLLIDGHLLGVHAGDRLQVFGQLTASQGPRNAGEFDFARHARTDRILSGLRTENPVCVTVVSSASPLNPRRWIDAARTSGQRVIRRTLDPRHAGLASTLLVGAREEVPSRENEAFVETGTIHILSISGMHVGILAATMFLFTWLAAVRRNLAAVLVAGTIVIYVLVTGAEPPAVRAMILVLVMCAGYAIGRRPLGFNSLAAAALVVLALNPVDLFRAGPQLSFMCVAVLCWFAERARLLETDPKRLDPLSRLIAESRPWPVRMARQVGRWAWDLTWVGAMVWLTALPLIMARFHILSVVAVILNTLLWLPISLILWSGLGVLALGGLLPWLAAPFAWCCNHTLGAFEWAIEMARQLPGAYFWVPGPENWWLAGLYGGLGLLVVVPKLRPPRRWCLAILAGWIGLGFLPGLLRREPPHLDCTFLAVDHGCCAVLRLPSGATMLYDAGRFASPDYGARSIAGHLWSHGIAHLDAIVLSHPDADHFNAVPALLERFSVGVVYVSPMMFERKGAAVDALRESIERAGVPVLQVAAGDRLRGGEGCRVEVFHPPRDGVLGGDNANSLVLAIEYLGRRILLPGDLEPPGLNAVIAEEPWHCDVLLAPHHGSQRSDPPGLAHWATPHWVVISGGAQTDLARTTAAYRAIGAEVLHTHHWGAIAIQIDATGLEIRPFLENPQGL